MPSEALVASFALPVGQVAELVAPSVAFAFAAVPFADIASAAEPFEAWLAVAAAPAVFAPLSVDPER